MISIMLHYTTVYITGNVAVIYARTDKSVGLRSQRPNLISQIGVKVWEIPGLTSKKVKGVASSE